MDHLYPHGISAAILAGAWVLVLLWLWTLHRQWVIVRAVRRAAWMVPLVATGLLGLWVAGTEYGWITMAKMASSIIALLLAISAALAVTLPLSGVILTIERLQRRFRRRSTQFAEVDQKRRTLVMASAAAIPVTAAAVAGFGVVRSMSAVRFPEITLFFPDLPTDLDGLRVLQLSDPHLGYYSDLDDFEHTMEEASQQRADLVLATGDISDDLAMLPGALRLMHALKPRLGVYASLGNHEYYANIKHVMKIIDAGPVPLLKDNGVTIPVGASRIYLGGVDDPVWALPQGSREVTLRDSLMRVMDGAPSDAFYLMMSHRPEGFDFAAAEKLHLTLSGHYHGGQVGYNGRSIFESYLPRRYMWGHYQRDVSQLYTSAGMGHWFPLRFNCPREAPVYVLRRGTAVGA
jgi:predicted MPP superfamily phosphohydrolase